MRRSGIRFLAVAVVAALAFAACSDDDDTPSAATNPTTTTLAETTTTEVQTPSTPTVAAPTTVALASSDLGEILVDSKGMTLYLFENDQPGAPACTGACLTAWPPLPAPASPTYGAGLDASKFSVVTASDGTKQIAANGMPLYLWVNDTKPGDVTGQNVNGFFVVGKDLQKVEPTG